MSKFKLQHKERDLILKVIQELSIKTEDEYLDLLDASDYELVDVCVNVLEQVSEEL